jgi:flagellar hook-length control protein FliK
VTGAASASTQSVAATLGQTAVTQTIASHPTSGDAPAAAPQTAPPLNQQVAPAVLNLRSAGAGTHILTLTVSPESVGPVTVRAHITGDSMRVELSAPTDQGRDALLSMLPDLKRDLSQGGMNSALSVASPNSDAATAGGQNQFGSSGGSFARDERPNYFRTAAPPGTAGPSARPASVGATTALDVLA